MIHLMATSDTEWCNERQQMATSDNEWYNEWQRVVQLQTNDEWQRVTTNDNELELK